jgi:hypothetical protein
MVDLSGGLIGEVIFGEPFRAMWDKNNNTHIFSLYQKLLIHKKKYSNK